ncbi:MAG: ABC transporter ATP-binding protein [Alphaproteobacteria bacterium TMED150]|nr:ABC transporter ATP-binding protein [Paracoccaceae bacterium]RPH13658.1 MAG: ABC transporter ATP-binding protein [Alphaproteobacteria bacterium TMED150]HBQ23276.1 ABC transporter ATP-binding protein [Alphaproteobacteria bacterium]|tara:strand:- start:179 stop:931 length:753 start_codon:yes stop_codon:yes gene_type:complete
MSSKLLEVKGLSKAFLGIKANDDVQLSIHAGEVHGLIGPNGAGKTTAISLLSGELRPDSGQVFMDGKDITNLSAWRRIHMGLARSYQISRIFPDMTLLQNVQVSLQIAHGHSFRFVAPAFGSHGDEALAMLAKLGLEDRAHDLASSLAHGLRRELELAVILARKPRMLLLDEPMAGMGKTESIRITQLLEQLRGQVTMLLVEHDMDVVFQLADRISVLVQGHVVATGTPEDIAKNPQVRSAYLGGEDHDG